MENSLKKSVSKLQILVFAVCYLSYTSVYIARLNFSVASVLLNSLQILDKTQIGLIGSIFGVTFALGKLPNGYIGDRIPSERMICIGLVLIGLSNIGIALAPVFWNIALLWAVNAWGQSMLWGPMLRTIAAYFDERHAKSVGAFLVSSVAFGSILGLWIGTAFSSAGSVGECFLVPGAVALAMAIAVWALFRKSSPARKMQKPMPLRRLFHNREFLMLVAPALCHGMIKDNLTIWLAVYFFDTFRLEISGMFWYILFIPLAGFLGRILFPPIYALFRHNEYKVSICAFIVCLAAILPLIWGGISAAAAMVCLGVISAMISIINTHILTVFPSQFASSGNIASVTGIMDVLTYGGAAVSSLFFGILIEHGGYAGMFVVWAAAALVSLALLGAFEKGRVRRKNSANEV